MTDHEVATGYVLGTLEGTEREAARIRAIEDMAFGRLVEQWERWFAPMALGAEVVPPKGLLDKIEARIRDSGVELPGTITRRANAGEWTDAGPGLRIKTLNQITKIGRQTFMAELSPGAEYTDHDHDQDEEIYMISGDLIIGDVVLKAGDFHVAHAGKHHPTHRTVSGCVCIISQAMGTV
jgi:quercetin dioxygenase-like cupin family protein